MSKILVVLFCGNEQTFCIVTITSKNDLFAEAPLPLPLICNHSRYEAGFFWTMIKYSQINHRLDFLACTIFTSTLTKTLELGYYERYMGIETREVNAISPSLI